MVTYKVMGYEDIEPPTPEVDRLYREIVENYKSGEYRSLDEALSILESQYLFSFIEIKEVMRKDFESYPFYLWGIGGIDEYIRACEKSETSLSSKERDIFVGIIDGIIKGIQKSDEEGDEPELMRSYEEVAQQVYMQVEKIRNICHKNRETKELYEKYKSQIESISEIKKEKKIGTEITQKLIDDSGKTDACPPVIQGLQEPEEIAEDKIPPRMRKMFKDGVITGYKINNRWIVSNEKHGIKELTKWADKNNLTFDTPYIIQTFCKQSGEPYTSGSVNTYKCANGLSRPRKKR